MRPDRFTQLLLAAARSLPDTTADLVTEDGRHLRPYLVSVTSGGKRSLWQVVATSAPGDKYAEPEKEPVVGERIHARHPEPIDGTPANVAANLASAIVEADAGEIARVELYADRAEPPAVQFGATFTFYDGSRIFLNRG